MTEHKLREKLGAKRTLPSIVENKMQAAYAQVLTAERKVTVMKKSRRGLRTALVLAAVVAVLGVGAAAIYTITRAETSLGNPAMALEGLFGDTNRPSTEAQTFEQRGITFAAPDEERVSVDDQAAIALLRDCLPEVGYSWQVGEYTIAVESYLLDGDTGTGKIYYSLARKGGIEGITVDPIQGVWYNGEGILLTFHAPTKEALQFSGRTYVDAVRTTEDKMYLALSFANVGPWDVADGVKIEFSDWRAETKQRGTPGLLATLSLPSVKSLPNIIVSDPDTGEEVLRFSAIGMKLHNPKPEDAGYVALEYADGTRYVVSDHANNIRNTNYELGGGDIPSAGFMLCFNRLVDPSQVVKVIVDGNEYTVK